MPGEPIIVPGENLAFFVSSRLCNEQGLLLAAVLLAVALLTVLFLRSRRPEGSADSDAALA